MKSSLHHGNSVDSIAEMNSFESSGHNPDLSINDDSTPNGGNARLLSQEGVFSLTQDVRTFSEALNLLKDVFLEDREYKNVLMLGNKNVLFLSNLKFYMSKPDSGGICNGRILAHERLGELLQILRTIVDNYPEINSSNVLTAAGELIKHIKEYNYEDEHSVVTTEIFRLINSLAMTFSSCVSECLTGDDINSPNITIPSPSFELNSSKSGMMESDEISPNLSDVPDPTHIDGDIDGFLSQLDSGIELALSRAKILSKYLGDLISYVKKKAHLEMEHSRNISKLSSQTKTVLSEQSFLPFQSLYCTSLEHEKDYAGHCQAVYHTICGKYAESLQAKKNEHDKKRKNIRESWARDRKRSEEAIAGMKKAKQNYFTKMQEYLKAKEAAIKAEEEQQVGQGQQGLKSSSASSAALSALYSGSASGKVDRKKKQEEDTNLKALIAEQAYRASIGEANKRTRDLDKNKVKYLQQLREIIFQCDQTAKSASLEFFHLHHQLYAPLPVQFQAMHEDAKRYEPGSQYSEFVRSLPLHPPHSRDSFHFENYPFNVSSFSGQGGLSETESVSSRSLDDLSPSGTENFRVNLMRRHSTEDSLSSDDILEDSVCRDGKPSAITTAGDTGFDSSPVPIRNFTKNAFKVAKEAFKGKKTSKSTLFGVEFSAVCHGCPDGVPFLIKKCVAEIDNRALTSKGIYRKNGVKNRVDKICAQFDTTPDRVDLSQFTPYDVAGALKSFLRQLPESLLLFRYYDTFLEIAKDYSRLNDPSGHERPADDAEGISLPRAMAEPFVNRLRDAVEQLPMENRNTLQCIVSHLSRVADHSLDNKMTPSNLAIVFGPTLLRRSAIDLNEPLETLVDLSHQSTVIKMLIVYKDLVFGIHPSTPGGSSQSPSSEISPPDRSDDPTNSSEGFPKAQPPASKQESDLRKEEDKVDDELGSLVPSRSRLNEDEAQHSSPFLSPRSSVVDPMRHGEDVHPSSLISRKIAITDDKVPSVDEMELPPLPTRRRKKSRKTSEDQTNKSNSAEPSQNLSNTFQAKIDKLGNLMRRISRERMLDPKHAAEKDEVCLSEESPYASRCQSSGHVVNAQSVLVLKEAVNDDVDHSASFC